MIYVYCVIKIFIIGPIVWLFKHKIALIGVVALVGGLYAYQACNRGNDPVKPQQVSAQEQLAPKVEQASHILQTYSRVYYLATFTQESDTKVILHKWWEWDGKRWVPQYSTVGVTFDKATTGDFRLVKR